MADDGKPRSAADWRELVAVVLLSVTAILTAWAGFQASKWRGAMSITFSQASTARFEAARMDGIANRRAAVQVPLFTQWLEAYQAKDTVLADFLQERFPEPLATAFPVWLESRPLKNPEAAATPFELPEYVIPELAQSTAANARASAKYAQALEYNQRGDNYTVLTVGFATVLFFAAISGRVAALRSQWVLLGVGLVGFALCAGFLLTFPKLF